MDIKYHEDFNLFTIDNVFPDNTNEDIFNEIIKNKSNFVDSTIGNSVIDKDYRSNTVSYFDNIYGGRREESVLLTSIDKFFKNDNIRSLLTSSPYPMNKFMNTNYHVSQVSRYGCNGQEYNFHSDVLNGTDERIITFVYYVNKEPKKFTGGDIKFSKLPILNGKVLGDEGDCLTLTPKNNMGVIFPSYLGHAVTPTKSSNKFEDGRFSLNCWIGRI